MLPRHLPLTPCCRAEESLELPAALQIHVRSNEDHAEVEGDEGEVNAVVAPDVLVDCQHPLPTFSPIEKETRTR
jgi:hypothetical protein